MTDKERKDTQEVGPAIRAATNAWIETDYIHSTRQPGNYSPVSFCPCSRTGGRRNAERPDTR